MFDSHCHLTDEQFAVDRAEVLERAWAAGLIGLTTIASNAQDAAAAIALAATDGRIRATAGIHPHVAAEADPAALEEIRAFATGGHVSAVGETGLDFHYDTAPRDVQRELFAWHLQLASDTGLPVVVHCRSADDDVAAMIAGSGVRGVLHCFAGNSHLLDTALLADWHISFAGIVTFRNFASYELVAAVPADRLLAETDSPYLAPVPHRGRRNEPAFVMETVRTLAAIRGAEPSELARQVAVNAVRFYGGPAAG